MAEGRPFAVEVNGRRKSGEVVPVLFSVVPRVPGDRHSGHIGVFTDLTAIKATEQALRDARDKAQAASRLKSQFLATLSHEIRTPLNAIMGMTELVMDTQLSPDQRDMLGIAHESSESLMRTINDMLDFSRIEAGKFALNEAPFDLGELIAHTCAMFHKRGQERGLLMQCEVAPDVPRNLMGDAVRIRQVLVNLLGNAFKFTEAGSVGLRVSRETTATGAEQLRFEVSDTGIGMTPEVLANLFQPFQQGDASSTRIYGGTGLGLSISKALVEMMGGRIEAFGEPGAGSKFRFSIALKPVIGPATDAP
jgi:signal transduction histidine kinase